MHTCISHVAPGYWRTFTWDGGMMRRRRKIKGKGKQGFLLICWPAASAAVMKTEPATAERLVSKSGAEERFCRSFLSVFPCHSGHHLKPSPCDWYLSTFPFWQWFYTDVNKRRLTSQMRITDSFICCLKQQRCAWFCVSTLIRDKISDIFMEYLKVYF